MLNPYKAALLDEIKAIKAEQAIKAVYLLLTNIMQEGSEMLVVADAPEVVEKAFGKKASWKLSLASYERNPSRF